MTIQTSTFIVGALFRRAFRRRLMADGLKFTEDKGLLDSLFVVTGETSVLNNLQRLVQRVALDIASPIWQQINNC